MKYRRSLLIVSLFLGIAFGLDLRLLTLWEGRIFGNELQNDSTDLEEESSDLSDDKVADQPESEIHPDYAKSILTVNQQSLSPVRVREHWPSEHLIGKTLVRLKEAKVESLENATGKVHWSIQSESSLDLRWLGEDQGIVFLAEVPARYGTRENPPEPLAGVLRLRIKDGSWLAPLMIPLEAEEKTGSCHLTDLLFEDDGILILNTTSVTDDGKEKRLGYRLTRFDSVSAQVSWSKFYKSAGTIRPPDAFLIGSYGPTHDNLAIQGLTRLESLILVCGGPLEDLIALDPADGKEAWKIPRIWEYRKGFIGPSVWEYFVERYGVKEHDLELAEMTLEEVHAKNKQDAEHFFVSDESYQRAKQEVAPRKAQISVLPGSIIAGPVVIDSPKENNHWGKTDGSRIFIVTAQDGQNDWTEYLSNCIVYELDEEGKCIGMLTLPRFPQRKTFSIIENSIVWKCMEQSRARMFPSPFRGNSDKTIDLEWRVDRVDYDPDAWYQNGRWSDEVVFAENSMISVRNGGLIETPESKKYCFRFRSVNLLTGTPTELLLAVPFEGHISPPTQNYSGGTRPDGKTTWVAFTGFPLALSGLEKRGDSLVIVLASQEVLHSLEFDIKAILNSAETVHTSSTDR